MASRYSFISLLSLTLVLGMPRFDSELREDSYATVTANGGRLMERPIKEQIAPEEAYIDVLAKAS